MAKVLLLSIAAIANAGDVLDLTWQDCGDASTHGTVTDVQPAQLPLGSVTDVIGSGTVDEDVDAGTFNIDVKALGVVVLNVKGDIQTPQTAELPFGAGSLTWKGMALPIPAGPTTITITVEVSAAIPASLAVLDVILTAADGGGAQIICAAIHTQAPSTEEATRKQYQRGYVRMPRNGLEVVAEITDEMRAAAPASLDWSAKGATTPVKDQGGCGSCWAYSATEGVESGYYMATGELISLSEQQMISCDTYDLKCQGGDLPTAYQYVQEAGGLDRQANYPDTSSASGFGGQCKAFTPAIKISEWKYAIPACPRRGACLDQQESDMMAALNSFGPLSVCVNAETWNFYTSGVFSRSCSGAESSLDHCVQLVGYDTTGSESYWKVRNSWAADWGENGFIRLAMGINQCGIADEATYVIASAAEGEISV